MLFYSAVHYRVISGDITNLNPIFTSDSASIDIAGFLWAGLFDTDPETALPIPDLATWEVSEDGLTYTFTIRDDAFWSDGTPITSADVDYTYRAIVAEDIPSPRKGAVELIDTINIIDEKTFEVILSSPNCTVWGNTFSALTPIPSHLFAEDFSDLDGNPFNTEPTVTSGPYVVDEWQSDEYIRLIENPEFYGGDPNIPQIFNRVLVDTTIINQSLLTQEIDYAPKMTTSVPGDAEKIVETSISKNSWGIEASVLINHMMRSSTAPPNKNPIVGPINVATGIRAFRVTCVI